MRDASLAQGGAPPLKSLEASLKYQKFNLKSTFGYFQASPASASYWARKMLQNKLFPGSNGHDLALLLKSFYF